MRIFSSVLKGSAITLAISLALVGCSAGSDDTAPLDGGETGPAVKGYVTGVISGFGSVFVDGVEFETTSSSITSDGQSATENDLDIGMLVTIDGTVNGDGKTGVASSITFDDVLEGQVTGSQMLENGSGILVVMGQNVIGSSELVFESNVAGVTDPSLIVTGNIVEVSGHTSGDGSIYGTRILVVANDIGGVAEVELKGIIKNTDTTANTFEIGAQTISYSAPSVSGLTSGEPVDGLYVKVASESGVNAATGELFASFVSLESSGKISHEGSENDNVSLEGVVTKITSAGLIDINGKAVVINDLTGLYQGTASSIVIGASVSVAGTLNSQGELIAEEIEFEAGSSSAISGFIEGVSIGTFRLIGQNIIIDNETIVKDNSANQVRYFGLDDLQQSDLVVAHGYRDSAGDYVATKLVREDSSAGSTNVIDGVVEALNGDLVTVDGFLIDITGYAAPTIGDRVEAEGTYDGVSGSVLASSFIIVQ